MGDISIVRGSHTGNVRAIEVTATTDVEEGDLVTIGGTAGEVAKIAENATTVAGVMLEDIDVSVKDTGMMAVLTPDTIVEGAGPSTMLAGDDASISSTLSPITFDEDGSNPIGIVYKNLGDDKIQVKFLAASIQM